MSARRGSWGARFCIVCSVLAAIMVIWQNRRWQACRRRPKGIRKRDYANLRLIGSGTMSMQPMECRLLAGDGNAAFDAAEAEAEHRPKQQVDETGDGESLEGGVGAGDKDAGGAGHFHDGHRRG